MKRYPTTLVIAGSDSGGGAGVQADIKTCSSLGVFATTAITGITAQNTQGVRSIQAIDATIVREQIEAVLDDFTVDSIKIGMLCNASIANTVADVLAHTSIPIILDPVMVSTSGHKLIGDDTIEVISNRLIPMAEVVTPNIAEACVLSQIVIKEPSQIVDAAHAILSRGCSAVLMKGGHLAHKDASDILVTQQQIDTFTRPFIATRNTHGTGCTLSSAIASFRARWFALHTAVEYAKEYVHKAILQGADVCAGKGHGALNHAHNPQPLTPIEYQPL